MSVVPDSVTLVSVPLIVIVKPAVSSSAVTTATAWSANGSNVSSDLASSTDSAVCVVWSPSSTSSSTPWTVTVWAVSQLSLVNVKLALSTVASPTSPLVTVSTTSDIGSLSSFTSNVSVVPNSVTLVSVPLIVIVKPAVSSSVVTTSTVWSGNGSKASSDLASSTDSVICVVWSPSSTSSSTPSTVTVWAVSQLSLVKVSVALSTVASSTSPLVTVSTTSDRGSLFSFTSNVSVAPDSATLVSVPLIVTVKPSASSAPTSTRAPTRLAAPSISIRSVRSALGLPCSIQGDKADRWRSP